MAYIKQRFENATDFLEVELDVEFNETVLSYGVIKCHKLENGDVNGNCNAPNQTQRPKKFAKTHKDIEAAFQFLDEIIDRNIKKEGFKLKLDKSSFKRPPPNVKGGSTEPKKKRIKTKTPVNNDSDRKFGSAERFSSKAEFHEGDSELEEFDNEPEASSATTHHYEFGTPPTKFWSITVWGRRTTIRYGPIGSNGLPVEQKHDDKDTACNFAFAKIKDKIKRGFRFVETITTESKPREGEPITAHTPAIVTSHVKGEDPVGELENGGTRKVGTHLVLRQDDLYSCTCAEWRYERPNGNASAWICPHIEEVIGEDAAKMLEKRLKEEKFDPMDNLPIKKCMLAQNYLPERHGDIFESEEWYMSEKLDGIRAIWDGTKFISRHGNIFFVPEEFVIDFPVDTVLDGELWAGRGCFGNTMSVVRSLNTDYEKWAEKITYQVFDAPLLDKPFEERHEYVKKIVKPIMHAHVIEQIFVKSEKQMYNHLHEIEADDGEGLMLRKKGSKYECKRSKLMLKVKTWHDAEAVVMGHKYNPNGKFRSLECQLSKLSGKKFTVSNCVPSPPPSVGTIITFRYFEMSKNGSPRFPVFQRVFKKV